MARAEVWARAHKGLVGLLAAAAAGLGVLLFLLHPKGQSAAQSAISYIPAPFSPQSGGAPGAGTTQTAAPAAPGPQITFNPPPGQPPPPVPGGGVPSPWPRTNRVPINFPPWEGDRPALPTPAPGPTVALKSQLVNPRRSSAPMPGVRPGS